MSNFFSIITVTYNNLDGLKRTEKSISNQTNSDFEWIIIDGASTDGTQEYLPQTKSNWISQPDQGIYSAMNKGINKTNGDYLIFMNAGDIFAKADTLKKIKAEITKLKSPPDFIYGDSLEEIKGKPPAYKKSKPHKNILQGMFTHHQAMLYNRSALAKLRYDQSYNIAADYDLTLRFLTLKKRRALYCAFPICLFESGGVSQNNAFKGRIEQFIVRQNIDVSPAHNLAIFLAQTLNWFFRQAFPKLYWKTKKK